MPVEYPLFQPLPEINLPVRGWNIEVRWSPEKMREDFLLEGMRRGYDSEALVQLGEAFSFKTVEKLNKSGDADVDLGIPLRTSIFSCRFGENEIQKSFEIIGDTDAKPEELKPWGSFHKRPLIDKRTPQEVVAHNTKNLLESLWRHEREHLLQYLYLSPQTRREADKITNKRMIQAFLICLGSPFVVSAIPAFIDVLQRQQLDFDFYFRAGFTAFIINMFVVLPRISHFLYRKNIIEQHASEFQFNGTNLDDIFEVSVSKAKQFD